MTRLGALIMDLPVLSSFLIDVEADFFSLIASSTFFHTSSPFGLFAANFGDCTSLLVVIIWIFPPSIWEKKWMNICFNFYMSPWCIIFYYSYCRHLLIRICLLYCLKMIILDVLQVLSYLTNL